MKSAPPIGPDTSGTGPCVRLNVYPTLKMTDDDGAKLMAAATFCVLPLVVVFLFGQRYFIEGIARTGIK